MKQSLTLFVLIGVSTIAHAGDKTGNWLQARSPHFLVVTNAGERQARQTADQFERMRAVFHDSFPNLAIDSYAPITVIAVRNEKEFRALEPEAYLAKGSLKLGGLFLRVPEKNYVLMRLDTEGDHPYSVIYHEYTHLLTSRGSEWMPLWLNEGLAEFYENTEVQGKEVSLGRPSVGNVLLLRQNRLLPLDVLFAVDHNSPYYHEENKGSIFYAEAWALTHMLLVADFKAHTHAVADYQQLLSKKVEPVLAATQSFGDLKQLQKRLESYIAQPSFEYFTHPAAINTKDLDYKIEPLTGANADAVRADFLAYDQRTTDARALLQQVLHDDPDNVSARETMGYLEWKDGHTAEARKWYAEAVKLDSHSYLANYNYAVMTMRGDLNDDESKLVENSLRAAIQINPQFAPAYDRLAVFYAMRHENLDEAHMLSLRAVSYEPDVIGFRVNGANILMEMNRTDDAVRVLETALNLAKNEQEKFQVDNLLKQAKDFRDMQRQGRALQASEVATTAAADAPVLKRSAAAPDVTPSPAPASRPERPFPPAGPKRVVEGTITGVQCSSPAAMTFQVVRSGRPVPLHSTNYYKVGFTALGFTPTGELHPCSDLDGKNAKVEYVDLEGQSEIVAIELRK